MIGGVVLRCCLASVIIHKTPSSEHKRQNLSVGTIRTTIIIMCGINHLCGINFNDPTLQISEPAKEVLFAFRKRYELDCPYYTLHSVAVDSTEEAKKFDSSPDNNSFKERTESMTPTYEIPFDHLHQSGWRPLDNVTLFRYLEADRRKDGSFDMEASYQRLIGALAFRRQYKSDIIVKNISTGNIPAHILRCQKLRVGIIAGTDHINRPVIFERLGEFFSSGHCHRATDEEWIETYLYFIENNFARMREVAFATGNPVSKMIYLADFNGIVSSILNRQIWSAIPLLKMLVNTVEHHYPEVVDKIIFFNVPRVAAAAWSVVRAFLNPATEAKVNIYNGVPLEKFYEVMSEDVVPIEYGGKNCMKFPSTLALITTEE